MTQAPIEPRHKDMAARAAGYTLGTRTLGVVRQNNKAAYASILAHAQTLANDEAKGKALAEIARLLGKPENWVSGAVVESAAIAATYRAAAPEYGRVHTDGSRSGGQPVTECPKCEAFRREVSDAVLKVWPQNATLSRFIIPASDPVAEAFKAAVYAYGGEAIEGENFDSAVAVLRAFIEGDR